MKFDGRLKWLGPAPVDMLRTLLPSVSEQLWLGNTYRQENFAPHRRTRSLIFRYVPGEDPREHLDLRPWLAWRALLEPTITAATEGLRPGRCCRILLANLPAGAAIEPHRDHGPTYETTHRVHVPIQTDPRVLMHIDGEDFHLESGQAYEINNLRVHGVTNASDVDRVHLIVDYLESESPLPASALGAAT